MSKTSAMLMGSLFTLALAAGPARAGDDGAVKNWKAKCASCHGPDGKAKTKQGEKQGTADITTPEWQKFTDEKIKAAINDGVKREKDGKKQDMKPMKDKLKAEEVDALVKYIRELAAK